MTGRKLETVEYNRGSDATGVEKVTKGWPRLNLWTVKRPVLTWASSRLQTCYNVRYRLIECAGDSRRTQSEPWHQNVDCSWTD